MPPPQVVERVCTDREKAEYEYSQSINTFITEKSSRKVLSQIQVGSSCAIVDLPPSLGVDFHTIGSFRINLSGVWTCLMRDVSVVRKLAQQVADAHDEDVFIGVIPPRKPPPVPRAPHTIPPETVLLSFNIVDKKTYNAWCKVNHPDKNKDSKESTALFQSISVAYASVHGV
jgi:hypothetical protein